MKQAVKNILNFLLRFGISAALLVYLYHVVDIDKTVQLISQADYKYVVYGLLLFVVINIFLILRWAIFIHALELSAPAYQIVRYFFASLAGNLFLPTSIGGDFLKIAGLCHHCPDKKHKVVGSVVLDRVSGYCGITLLALVAFLVGFKYVNDPGLVVPILGMIFVFFGMIFVILNKTLNAWVIARSGKFPRLASGLQKFHEDMTMMAGKHRYSVLAVIVTCVNQLLFAGCFFLIARALHQEVPFIYFAIFIPLVCVASAVPSIGGLGAREAGAAYLFAHAGMASGTAVSMSLMTFIYMVVFGIAGGLYYVFTLSSGRVQHPVPDSGVSGQGTGGAAARPH